MKKESKAILGHRYSNRLYFAEKENMLIIEDYLSGNETKQSVYERYTGYTSEHGKISKWMRKFDIEDKFVKNTNFVSMPKMKKVKESSPDDFETLKLKK